MGTHSEHDSSLDAIAVVDRCIGSAVEQNASDIHVEPAAANYEIRYRIDGVLQTHATHPVELGRAMVSRLMVMAELLTYRRDVPQEGRMTLPRPDNGALLEIRVSIMPTTQGLRAALRLPTDQDQPHNLDDLDLPDPITKTLREFARTDTGLLLLTGPAGSGKTTTIYALLDHILTHQPGQSIVTLEDPVERDLPAVTQIQVTPFGELTYARALRSMLRQDPQILMIGEVRDAETAQLVTQAALSGHRMISTLHAGSPATAITRLLDMGLEPYQVTSALFAVVSQRLLRRSDGKGGYRGRFPIAEAATMTDPLRQAILSRADAATLEQNLHAQNYYVTLKNTANHAVVSNKTDHDEVHRILGT